MRFFILGLCSLALLGCGGDSKLTSASQTITISSVGATTTIDETGTYNLTISGMNNTLSIAGNNTINTVAISGQNNFVTFGNNVSLQSFTISGTGNTINVPTGSGITFSDSGSSNTLIEY